MGGIPKLKDQAKLPSRSVAFVQVKIDTYGAYGSAQRLDNLVGWEQYSISLSVPSSNSQSRILG